MTTEWSLEWWLVNTPLHLLWEGTAAVYVFFILSGLVLAKAVYASDGSFGWRVFYTQRLLRLYLPIWAAVLFTVFTFSIVPRTADMGSAWIQAGATEVTLSRTVRDLTLVLGTGGLSSPLWSLRWEILFSLLLPLYVWVAYLVRRRPLLTIAGCLMVVAAGDMLNQDVLRYMPMFAIGVLLFPLIEVSQEMQRNEVVARKHAAGAPILVLGLLLLNLRWLAPALTADVIAGGVLLGLSTLGAIMVVICASQYPPVARFLSSSPLLWLGRISFSLYLVHEPIIIGTAYLFGPGNEYIASPVAMAASFIVCSLFFRFVERPSHMVAKKAAKVIGRTLA